MGCNLSLELRHAGSLGPVGNGLRATLEVTEPLSTCTQDGFHQGAEGLAKLESQASGSQMAMFSSVTGHFVMFFNCFSSHIPELGERRAQEKAHWKGQLSPAGLPVGSADGRAVVRNSPSKLPEEQDRVHL